LTLHFCNQSDPAFCGITTLLVCLNAMSIDPQTRWKGGWRYFGDEESLLARCCLEPERIRSEGINLDEFGRLAACQGLLVKTRRATATTAAQKENGSLDDFRRDVVAALTIQDDGVGGEAEDDGRYDGGDGDEDDGASRTPSRLVVASFGRSGLSQTGDGHFSPLAAYHAGSDRVLVLDVARFKYPPYWVGAKELHAAMALKDESTGRPRGWIVLENRRRRGRSKRSLLLPSSSFLSGGADADEEGRRSGDSGEDRRPARLVPPQQQASWCPMHKAKVEYCENQRRVTPASFGEGYGGGAEGRGGGASQ
jgi:glutathione gamma-glutamylcysteinyltransferase